MATKQKVTPYRNIDVQVTASQVDANACKLRSLVADNNHATALRYLKLYDKATAPTEADTPIHTFPLAPNVLGAKLQLNLVDVEIPFALGCWIRASTGRADNDTGAPTAGDVVVNFGVIENLDHTL